MQTANGMSLSVERPDKALLRIACPLRHQRKILVRFVCNNVLFENIITAQYRDADSRTDITQFIHRRN